MVVKRMDSEARWLSLESRLCHTLGVALGKLFNLSVSQFPYM